MAVGFAPFLHHVVVVKPDDAVGPVVSLCRTRTLSLTRQIKTVRANTASKIVRLKTIGVMSLLVISLAPVAMRKFLNLYIAFPF